MDSKRQNAIRLLLGVAAVLLVVIYVSPIWWVALKAPNYPPEAFPDGVRIHFHMNGVFNGCTLQHKAEVEEDEALDCVHEMDAINHFVGMHPIAAGGVLEKAFSPGLLAMLAVMLIGFAIHNTTLRLGAMAAGFAAIAVWMGMIYHGSNGIRWEPDSYVSFLVTSLGEGKEEEGEPISPIIAKLKEELEAGGQIERKTGAELRQSLDEAGHDKLSEALAKLHAGTGHGEKTLKEILAEAKTKGLTGKALDIAILKDAFEADQAKLPAEARQPWNGSVKQVLFWHYEKSLGRWFNQPERIKSLVAIMTMAGTVVFWGVIAGMLAMMVVAVKRDWPLFWVLAIIPALLPVFFIGEYAAWLWWYGHSMNEMGAFSLKPFMPTVFGQGKVAQFTTLSYPSYGFGVIMLFSALVVLAMLIRRKARKDNPGTT